ncbi:slit homolog 2 protein-like [Hydra vulgaris]|uniref:Slit homolog 2 protein-like n=1 Tax=Hydra vulgaris TaxID=6087 RepID=A0ABM4CGX7_HYDVU
MKKDSIYGFFIIPKLMVSKLMFFFGILGQITLCPIVCRCYDSKIYCMYNNISTSQLIKMLPHIPKDLRHLELSGNLIESFPAEHFEGFQKLEYLGLNNNNIVKLPPRLSTYLPNLKTIFLNGNNIEELSFSVLIGYENIETMSLKKNKIKNISDFSFQKLEFLRELFLSENYITQITQYTFYGLRNLQKLLLNNNLVNTIHKKAFSNTTHLVDLFLHSNNLEFVPEGIVSGLHSLQILTLNNNKIRYIHQMAFQNSSKSIKELLLNKNQITALPLHALSNINIARINLQENPIFCSCFLTMTAITNPIVFNNIVVSGNCLKPFERKLGEFSNITNYRNCSMCDLTPCKYGFECRAIKNTLNFFCSELKKKSTQPQLIEHIDQSIKNTKMTFKGSKPVKLSTFTWTVLGIIVGVSLLTIALLAFFKRKKSKKNCTFKLNEVESIRLCNNEISCSRFTKLS